MITVYIDGACEPRNPGGYGACAFAAFHGNVGGREHDPRGAPIKAAAQLIGNGPEMTNNVAEYRALRGTLLWFLSQGLRSDPIRAFMDSQLVVYQLSGQWQCNAPRLQAFKAECAELMARFPDLVLTWVPREQNHVADALINALYKKHNIQVMARRPRK